MTRYVIVPIVEGHGEVGAVPVLLNRWLRDPTSTATFEVSILPVPCGAGSVGFRT